MLNQILVPSLGESVTEATVSKWLKQVGEKVDSDEPLVELETDKVNVEVPSPLSGTLSSIKVKEGDTVEVGALLGLVQEGKSSSMKIVKMGTSDQNQQLKDTRTADQSSLNQNNIVTSNIISSSNQNNIIKPQIRDESLHWSMANNLVQTI